MQQWVLGIQTRYHTFFCVALFESTKNNTMLEDHIPGGMALVRSDQCLLVSVFCGNPPIVIIRKVAA